MFTKHEKTADAAGLCRLAVFLTMVIVLVPPALIYRVVWPRGRFQMPMFFHRLLLRLLNITVTVHGTMATAAPVFFVCNHISYLDIPVLGARIPGAFVAKAEVASWPLFGFLAKVQNTLFIERRAARAAEQSEKLRAFLETRQNVILFPEGTSSDGREVLPFKSSLFSIVDAATATTPITVQPVSLALTSFDGHTPSAAERDLYAWYGDMTLMPHLWQAFRLGGFGVRVTFHDAIAATAFPDRKQLAAHCHERVAAGLRG